MDDELLNVDLFSPQLLNYGVFILGFNSCSSTFSKENKKDNLTFKCCRATDVLHAVQVILNSKHEHNINLIIVFLATMVLGLHCFSIIRQRKRLFNWLGGERSTKTSLRLRNLHRESLIQLIYRFWMSSDSSLSASANQAIMQSIELGRIKTLCESPCTPQCPQLYLETHWQLMPEIRGLAWSTLYDTLINKSTATYSTRLNMPAYSYTSKTQTTRSSLPWSETVKHLCQWLPSVLVVACTLSLTLTHEKKINHSNSWSSFHSGITWMLYKELKSSSDSPGCGFTFDSSVSCWMPWSNQAFTGLL